MTTVFARVPFTYGGQVLERGELTELRGLPRDDQLRGLGYFITYDPHEHSKMDCPNCGRVFCNEGFLVSHKRKKGGCLAESAPITNAETAELLDIDPKKVVVED